MRTDLYQDMYETESHHWWHIAKRKTIIALLKKYMHPTNNLKIADIGCGTGKNLEEFSRFGHVTGVDQSPEALKFCKIRGLSDLVEASVEKLPLRDNEYDAITLLDVLEHIDEHPSLREIFRILKPGGILIVTVPAFQFLWSSWDVVLHHKRRYTASQLSRTLLQAGFVIQKLTYLYAFLVLPAFVIRRLKKSSPNYGSDFKIGNRLSNVILGLLSCVERVIALSIGIPFGTSVVCVAKKPLI
jgi:ubiquinone/menaquinone biosynthesis C-methylase UbiE